MKKRVVITGIGIYSSIGKNIEEVTKSLYEGKSGIGIDPERTAYGYRSPLTGILERPKLKGLLERRLRIPLAEEGEYAYMNGEKVILQSENNKNEINLNSSKQFQQISKIILGGVSGNGLMDSSDFRIFFYTSNEDYKLQLQPLKKEIKSLFSQINLFVSKGDGSINKVEMIEKTGDKTIIRFLSMKRNIALNDEVFSH